MTRHDAIAAVGVTAFAFALRFWHLVSLRESPFFDVLVGDAWRYHQWAREIAGGEWLGSEIFVQAPLYPYFLGIVTVGLGDDLWTIRLVQILLGSAACGFLALAAARFFASYWTGIVAGGMLAVYAPVIFHDGLLQKSILDTFFLCLLLWSLGSNLDRNRLSLDAATGLTLGLLILTRENAALFGLAIVAWILAVRSVPLTVRLGRIAAFALGVLLVLSPVALRNFAVGGEFHLTTSQLGHNLYIGNNVEADGTYRPLIWGRGDSEWIDGKALAEDTLGRTLSPAEVSDYWTTEVVEYVRSEPLDWLQLLGKKFILAWNATEIIDTEDQYTHALFSPLLSLSGTIFHFGVLAPLALFGAIATWSRRDRLWLLYLMIAAYTSTLLAFFILARYRLPLVPLLVPFAAAAFVEGPGWIRAMRKHRPGLLAAAGLSVALLVALANFFEIDRVGMQATNYYNLGISQRRADEIDASISSFQRSVAIVPQYSEAHAALGNSLAERGDFEEAFKHFEAALELESDVAIIHENFGLALSRSGDLEAASDAFNEAVRVDPALAGAHYYNGLAQLRSGRFEEARTSIEEAIRLDPDHRIKLRHSAWLHSTSPEAPSQFAADRTLQMARWAVLFGGQDDAQSLSTLSAALASAGQFARAIRAADRSVALARTGGDPVEISVMQARYDFVAAGRRIQR